MHKANSAIASIYKLEQDVETLNLTFYVYHNRVHEEQAHKLYTQEELFSLLCEMGREYRDGDYEEEV